MKFRYHKLPIIGGDPRHPLVPRPYIPVYLFNNNQRTQSPYYALLDSGADRVIFPADLAEPVGIDDITENAVREPTVGIAGQTTDVYYHDLAIEVVGDDRTLPLSVGFAHHIAIPILGRAFFQHYAAVTFHERKEEMELKP